MEWPRKTGKRPDVPPVIMRPNCAECGERLHLATELRQVAADAAPPARLVSWRWDQSRECRWCSVWTGHYGPYADDRFCSLKCGHAWAIKRAPIHR